MEVSGNMRIAIIGTGAVGGYYGALQQQAGADVLVQNPETRALSRCLMKTLADAVL